MLFNPETTSSSIFRSKFWSFMRKETIECLIGSGTHHQCWSFLVNCFQLGILELDLWHSIIYAKYLPIVKSEKVVFWEVHILTNFIFIFQVSNFWNSQIFFSAHILEPEPSLMRCSKFDWPRKSTIVHEECVAVHT